MQTRDSILSLREDLLPLLIARQFKGAAATFGSSVSGNGNAGGLTTPTSGVGGGRASGTPLDGGLDESARSSASGRRQSPQATYVRSSCTAVTTISVMMFLHRS